ncbi:hypothetical protein N9F44_00285, partial [Akkermansiaceae bacterium]|nr:hypothetical protein [Akkermansiaceae bacterium]
MKDGAYSRMPGKAPRNHPLKKRILALIGGEEGRPLNKSEIARELSLPGSKRAEFRDILREMEKAGDITYGKKGRFSAGSSPAPKDRKNASRERKPKSSRSGGSPELVGKIRLNPAGHGWFMPDYNDEGNLNSGVDMSTKPRFYTASNALSTSLDGDIVRVRLVKPTGRPPASRQGMKPDM